MIFKPHLHRPQGLLAFFFHTSMDPLSPDTSLEIYQAEIKWLEEGWEEEEQQQQQLNQAILAGLLFLGAEEEYEAHLAQCWTHQRYLTHPDLMPNPCLTSPWKNLLHYCQDQSFITTMGLDCCTFDKILLAGFEEQWNSNPIP